MWRINNSSIYFLPSITKLIFILDINPLPRYLVTHCTMVAIKAQTLNTSLRRYTTMLTAQIGGSFPSSKAPSIHFLTQGRTMTEPSLFTLMTGEELRGKSGLEELRAPLAALIFRSRSLLSFGKSRATGHRKWTPLLLLMSVQLKLTPGVCSWNHFRISRRLRVRQSIPYVVHWLFFYRCYTATDVEISSFDSVRWPGSPFRLERDRVYMLATRGGPRVWQRLKAVGLIGSVHKIRELGNTWSEIGIRLRPHYPSSLSWGNDICTKTDYWSEPQHGEKMERVICRATTWRTFIEDYHIDDEICI